MEEGEDKSPLLDEVGLETPSQMISKEVAPVCRERDRRGCSGLITTRSTSLVPPPPPIVQFSITDSIILVVRRSSRNYQSLHVIYSY